MAVLHKKSIKMQSNLSYFWFFNFDDTIWGETENDSRDNLNSSPVELVGHVTPV